MSSIWDVYGTVSVGGEGHRGQGSIPPSNRQEEACNIPPISSWVSSLYICNNYFLIVHQLELLANAMNVKWALTIISWSQTGSHMDYVFLTHLLTCPGYFESKIQTPLIMFISNVNVFFFIISHQPLMHYSNFIKHLRHPSRDEPVNAVGHWTETLKGIEVSSVQYSFRGINWAVSREPPA